jgi:hypothetical protein
MKKKLPNTLLLELGERVCRDLLLENTGARQRRRWWIVSCSVLGPLEQAA